MKFVFIILFIFFVSFSSYGLTQSADDYEGGNPLSPALNPASDFYIGSPLSPVNDPASDFSKDSPLSPVNDPASDFYIGKEKKKKVNKLW